MKMTLAEWRRAKGFTQTELAQAVKVSTKSISRYENEGFASASFSTMQNILETLEIKLDQLEFLEEDK